MEDLKVVAKELLRPLANLLDWPVVLQNFAHGAAVAEPKEFGAADKFAVLTDTPATAGSLAHKRMKMPLVRAATGTEANGS
jgi:hypothetical protein